jgi:hypothetical protein
MLHLLKITALATVFAINAAVATTPFFIGTTQINVEANKDAKTLLIDLQNLSKDAIKITIKDSDGEVLKSSTTKGEEDITYRLNLAKLPQGVYQISFASSTTEFIQPFEVTEKQVTVSSDLLVEKHKPAFHYNDDKLDINLLNKSKTPVSVVLHDEKGNKVLEDTTTSADLNYGRRFDLSQLEEGSYDVTVKTNNSTYSYQINR